MSSSLPEKIHTAVNRAVYFAAPNWLIYFYVTVLSLAYIVVVVHTPLTLCPPPLGLTTDCLCRWALPCGGAVARAL